MATRNPAFAGEGDEADEADADLDIEAALKDGALTAEQAVVLQERQLRAEMVAQMEQMKGELEAKIAGAQLGAAESGATLASVVKSVVARLTETPTNFHQAMGEG